METGIDVGADLVLIDVGPNLGALNHAALVVAEDVVIPLAPDLYSLQGLCNLRPHFAPLAERMERTAGTPSWRRCRIATAISTPWPNASPSAAR